MVDKKIIAVVGATGAQGGGLVRAILADTAGEFRPRAADVYRGFGFPGADDMGNMFQFKRDLNDYSVGVRDVNAPRKLNPELQTFDKWLERHKDEFPVE